MMLVSRPFYQKNSPRGIRPTLKMPLTRDFPSYTSFKSPTSTLSFEKSIFESKAFTDTDDYKASSSFKSPIALSTPSPSATANGNVVDFEFEKFRRLSEEWIRNRDFEEAKSHVENLSSRSPSPQRIVRSKSPARSRSASPEKNSRRRTPSPEKNISQNIYRRSASVETPIASQILKARSPSPLRYSPITKTFTRADSPIKSTVDYVRSPRSSTPQNIPVYRRSNSYERDSSSPTKFVNTFKRSNSYTSKDFLPNNFLRSRSASPQGLHPASSYYNKYNGIDPEKERTYSNNPSSYPRSPLSPHRNLDDIPENTYSKLKSAFNSNSSSKYNTLPNSRYFSRRISPSRDNILTALFNNKTNIDPRKSDNNGYYYLPTARYYELKNFIPNSSRESSPVKMSNSPRRYSEESYRKSPFASFDDELVARRRFSDELKKKPYNISDLLEEYYDQQRRLSEAGIRKMSDASLILNEDTDSFIIGDRVWVGGSKPGAISYIGETQFAPGEWAGVTLDEDTGKNNGSVAGIRYFQCEPRKGIFTKLTRLSRYPLTGYDLEILASRTPTLGSESPRSTPAHSTISAPALGSGGVSRRMTPTNLETRRATPPPSYNSESLRQTTPSAIFRKPSIPLSTTKKPISANSFDLKIGDKVLVDSNTGVKYGVLRFLGQTEFATGFWVGIELDEPTGKNDGSVAGKKYFICQQKYGLFAPIDRVSRQGSSRRGSGVPIPSGGRTSIPSLRRSNSRESLGGSSVASSTMSSSLRGTRRPSRTSGYGTGNTSKGLQNVREILFF